MQEKTDIPRAAGRVHRLWSRALLAVARLLGVEYEAQQLGDTHDMRHVMAGSHPDECIGPECPL